MFDSLTAAALADQLSRDIESGRVQRLGLISRQAIWFEIYASRRRSYLVASAENQASAVYLTDTEPVGDRQLVTPLAPSAAQVRPERSSRLGSATAARARDHANLLSSPDRAGSDRGDRACR